MFDNPFADPPTGPKPVKAAQNAPMRTASKEKQTDGAYLAPKPITGVHLAPDEANKRLAAMLAAANAPQVQTATPPPTTAAPDESERARAMEREDTPPNLWTEEQHAEAEKAKNKKFAVLYEDRKRLGEFPDPLPDSQNPKAIFQTSYLRKGGFMLLVSTLGVGKSTFVSQGSECWARGLPFMGFAPAKPLSIGVFETEDDADEIADFRNNFRKGFRAAGWTDVEISESENGENAPTYYPLNGISADNFLGYLEYCQSNAKHDLIIINPAYDFVPGDISKQDVISAWKTGLFALMEKHAFAVLLVHHTNKVPCNAKERQQWNTGASAAYAGSGSMVLPSAARSVVFIRPIDNKDGLFEMVAAKRGKRLGWKDGEGNPTITKYIAHSDGLIFWREATPEEAKAASPKSAAAKILQGAQRVVNAIKNNGAPFASKAELFEHLRKTYPMTNTTYHNWLNSAIDLKLVKCGNAKAGCSTQVGLPSMFSDEDENPFADTPNP